MQEKITQLQVIFLALALGQLLFCFVVVYLILTNSLPVTDMGAITSIVLPLELMSIIGLAYVLNRQRLSQGASLGSPKEKIQHYRVTVILRLALVEGANLFALVIAMLESELALLAYFAVGMLAFLYFRPVKGEFEQAYG